MSFHVFMEQFGDVWSVFHRPYSIQVDTANAIKILGI